MKSALRTAFLLVSVLMASALLGACGEDGPHLYFVQGPDVSRDQDNHVVVSGELWSVISWPEGDSFCVTATWVSPAPPNSASPMAEVCSSDAVPAPNSQDGWMVNLRSATPVDSSQSWTLDVSLSSDFNENKGSRAAYELQVP